MTEEPDHAANCLDCSKSWEGWATVSNADRHHEETGHTVELRIREIETVLGGEAGQ